jgi:hypothetical protein
MAKVKALVYHNFHVEYYSENEEWKFEKEIITFMKRNVLMRRNS